MSEENYVPYDQIDAAYLKLSPGERYIIDRLARQIEDGIKRHAQEKGRLVPPPFGRRMALELLAKLGVLMVTRKPLKALEP